MFSIIVAVSKNGVIGKDNSLIWHIPEDLKRFKELTMGKKIVMGRKTFESLPCVLPNRQHIVLTRDKNYEFNHNQVEVVTDLNKIIDMYKDSDEEVFIIGGGEIYTMFLDYTKKLYITEVLKDFKGDTYFPKINTTDWTLVCKSPTYTNNNLDYRYLDYILN